MEKQVLITGGAGFIGSHLADELLAHGYGVRVLDNLSLQVHGNRSTAPDYLSKDAEFIHGDVRNADAVRQALQGVSAVFHFAAAVGVGQSMYQICDYTSVNNSGTATLLEELIRSPVERLIVASSMSLYGEGLYRDHSGRAVVAKRSADQLRTGKWELHDESGQTLAPVPTPESKQPQLTSIYALCKFDQEQMCMITSRAYGFGATALRFFNVYGPRQALSNPYTGVMAIFASRLLNRNQPLIFEDGLQQRDFVNVHDIARACRLALESPEASGDVFNIGSGRPVSILQVAETMQRALGCEGIEPEITGRYRVGDIRHCYADISQAERVLGYQPIISFDEGVKEIANWLANQRAEDHVTEAYAELAARRLSI